MGRELRRVPLDFNWPIGQIWKGYWNPYSGMKCKTCDSSGYGPDARRYKDEWYGLSGRERYIPIQDENSNKCRYDDNAHEYHLTQTEVDALIAHNRLRGLCRDGKIPTVEEVNHWAIHSIFGHDSTNEYICMVASLKERGIEDCVCPICKGKGIIYPTDEIAKKADKWWDDEKFDPPKGDGYQLWDTTGEGSPYSPVFATVTELAKYCAKNCTVFGFSKWTEEQWLEAFNENPDMIVFQQGNALFI